MTPIAASVTTRSKVTYPPSIARLRQERGARRRCVRTNSTVLKAVRLDDARVAVSVERRWFVMPTARELERETPQHLSAHWRVVDLHDPHGLEEDPCRQSGFGVRQRAVVAEQLPLRKLRSCADQLALALVAGVERGCDRPVACRCHCHCLQPRGASSPFRDRNARRGGDCPSMRRARP